MRRRRRIMALAAAVLAVAPWSSLPAFGQQHGDGAVKLAAVTTVVAPAYSASIVVSVPKAVRFPGNGYLDLPYLQVTGSASAAAMYLVPVGTRVRQDELPMFGQLPTSLGRHTIANFPDGDEVIAAGLYRLVVVHSPGSATLTIRLPGLTGRTAVHPRVPSSARLELLRPDALGPGQYAPTGTSGVVTRRLAATGFLNVNAGVRMSVGGVSHAEGCMYVGGSGLPDEAGLLPGCSDGSAVGQVVVQGPMSYATGDFLNWGPGAYGLAVDYQATALPTGVAGWAAWVPYDG